MNPNPDHAFHLHLERCPQCRSCPYRLCAEGQELLLACGEPSTPFDPATEPEDSVDYRGGG